MGRHCKTYLWAQISRALTRSRILPDLFPRFLESTFAEAFRFLDEIVQICERLVSRSPCGFFFFLFSFFLRRRVNVFNDEFFSPSRSPRRTDYYYYYRLKIRGEKGSFVSFHSFNKMKGKFKNSSIFEKKRDYLFKNLYIVRKEKPNLKLRKCF